jgi:hypothetical protein
MSAEKSAAEWKPSFFTVANALVGLGLFWAAFGYVSLRTFCNLNAIPLPADLSTGTYLQEFYALTVPTFENLCAGFLIVLVLGGTATWVLPATLFDRTAIAIKRVLLSKAFYWVIFGYLLAGIVLFGRINVYLHQVGSGTLVAGKLSSEHLQRINLHNTTKTLEVVAANGRVK